VILTDRGPGLPQEVREHLFEPFVTTRPMGEGTGLGLYTSHMIAHELGGALSLEDNAPRGTRATLTLPVRPPGVPLSPLAAGATESA
jgi:two-component system C4-dicarboxylate transport sensor histidine kinase DctB